MKQTPSHDHYNAALLRMLPPGLGLVVEVGCSRGALARAYLEANPGCRWIGIDVMEDNVAAAGAVCTEALCRNIEQMSDADLAGWAEADGWVFGDTLEHLVDPWAVLSRIHRIIKPEGRVFASIPNAQNWTVQVALNIGQFRYVESGLLDRTHLRFFTRLTMIEMFESCGFRLEAATGVMVSAPDEAKYLPHLRALAAAVGADPDQAEADARPIQFVVRAAPV